MKVDAVTRETVLVRVPKVIPNTVCLKVNTVIQDTYFAICVNTVSFSTISRLTVPIFVMGELPPDPTLEKGRTDFRTFEIFFFQLVVESLLKTFAIAMKRSSIRKNWYADAAFKRKSMLRWT